MKKIMLAMLSLLFFAAFAEEIKLPAPDLKGGKKLMECFAQRRSLRKFDGKALPLHVIAEILYAADGMNRADGRKTVPTALNKQNQKVYAVTADGAYLYNSKNHTLELVEKGDFRKESGMQPFVAEAPLVLIYVSDMSVYNGSPEQKFAVAGTHAGSASQNVYLYAASENMAAVLCGSVKKDAMKKRLKLQPQFEVIYAQPIGFPAK